MKNHKFDGKMLVVKGASEHNLQDVDVSIPHHALVAMTGVSGSGKSSLAFDTIFKDGQRRYLASLSSHARMFLGKTERPLADHIEGMAPSISVDQKTVIRHPRSTVGTLSEIYDYLRLLFSKEGEAFCPDCQIPLEPQTSEGIASAVSNQFPGESFTILAPLIEGHAGRFQELLRRSQSAGYEKVRVDGAILTLHPLPELLETRRHTIDLVVEEHACPQNPSFISTLEKALHHGKGQLKILCSNQEVRYSISAGCPQCGVGFPERGPRLFSFNSPYGACSACKGLGVTDYVDKDLLIAHPNRTIREGALKPTLPNGYIVYSQVTIDVLNQVCQANGFHVNIPWNQLTKTQQDIVLYGSDKIKIPFGKHPLESRLKWSGITAKPREEGYYKGIIPVIEETLKRSRNKNILRFVSSAPCSACMGSRLSNHARSIRINKHSIADLTNLTLSQLGPVLNQMLVQDSTAKIVIAPILNRIDLLSRLGLGYLQLSRQSGTLSGGEAQRIRLATQIGAELRGALYVLDEPSMGLHRHDRDQLLSILRQLQKQGNSVICVEHDAEAIASCDWLVDLGPGAGTRGGKLLFNGPPQDLIQGGSESKTRAFLLHEEQIPVPTQRRAGNGKTLTLRGAVAHNLKNLTVSFKQGALNIVTGVSGSGKSTLVDHTLAKALKTKLQDAAEIPGEYLELEGWERVKKLIHIDQSPIGRTPRSNPATYTGLFDHIRNLFAELPLSRQRGWNKGRFSFNVKGGRCEDCQGAGVQVIGMHGLADVEAPCPNCEGNRFTPETLEAQLHGHTILNVLNLTIDEACLFFKDHPTIHRILTCMQDIGLGYITLGQSATTLSGGEAQRVKLASELGKPSPPGTLYILDEPTTGLHMSDVKTLLQALNSLLEKGHTIIAIEHHPDVIKCADLLVDLGPGSGDQGGQLVAWGTPEDVAGVEASKTGKMLQSLLRGTPKTLFQNRTVQAPPTGPIQMKGVTTHNLKDINVEIPWQQLTVVTGVSGSGKSSLAFDTLYAEGLRLYTENLSTYARKFIKQRGHAQFQGISGLSPAIAISQKIPSNNPRSTLGSMTEIDEYLRLLMSRAGTPHCSQCTQPLDKGQCPQHGVQPTSFSARMFSFNHHSGACTWCRGLGFFESTDPQKLITHPHLSLWEGAMSGHKTGLFYGDPRGQHLAILETIGRTRKIDFNRPWQSLSPLEQSIALHGTGETLHQVTWLYNRKGRSGKHQWETAWSGFINLVNEEYERKRNDKRGDALKPLLMESPCPACKGQRLKSSCLAVHFHDFNIYDMRRWTVDHAHSFFQNQPHQPITRDIGQELLKRLQALQQVGLGYLNLDRLSSSLSGGEAQRVRLAAQLGGGLQGVTYVLDEPTTGLHPRDIDRLIMVLKKLKDQGNTLVVVEHDEAVIRAADHIIDMGPLAGEGGGKILARGTPQEIMDCAQSLTGRYLTSSDPFPKRAKRQLKPGLEIKQAHANNLKNLSLHIPSGGIIAITGVSGSGKSTLVFDVVGRSGTQKTAMGCESIKGFEHFQDVVVLDRTPIGNSTMSIPATYLGFYDHIRNLFVQTQTAKMNGFNKSRFSFNVKGGRCETCQGMGWIKSDMDFLPESSVLCGDCEGRRFNSQTLECLHNGFSIADVLDMTLSQASLFFEEHKKIGPILNLLIKVGLGYLKPGQATSTLSGGEAMRLKLVAELMKADKAKKHHLYLFDEPTTGLHFHDLTYLLNMMHQLADQGHTLIVVEHHLEVIRQADHVIDLGPEGGNMGGHLIFQGEVEELAQCEASFTGQFLTGK